jgi:hypothetical protein
MADHFTMISAAPTPEFVTALEASGITIRGWEVWLSKRKTRRNTLKTEQGWVDPNDHSGDLKLTADDRRAGVLHCAADCSRTRHLLPWWHDHRELRS